MLVQRWYKFRGHRFNQFHFIVPFHKEDDDDGDDDYVDDDDGTSPMVLGSWKNSYDEREREERPFLGPGRT